LPLLHPEVLTEVLAMRQMTVEEIGVEKERLLQMFGPEALLRAMDAEQAMQAFIRVYGRERMRELLDRAEAPTSPAEKDGPNSR
jgi:hypothetical protein